MASDAAERFNSKENSPLFKYILLFILFLAIGIVVGIFGSLEFLKEKNTKDPDEKVAEVYPEDITKKEEYKELVDNLLSILDANPLFYNSNGVSVSSMDNVTKLTLVYNRLYKNQQGTSETLEALWAGASNCSYDFITDNPSDGFSTGFCNINKYPKSLFTETSKSMFNDSLIALDSNFNPSSGRLCVSDGDFIICGNVVDNSGITGALESKFSVIKVTKDEDGSINIYEKGYLVDNRSNVIASGQYENYYLHSSDSDAYYSELRNADNLTFVHKFKTDDKKNYYYVSTVLYKE